MCTSLFNLCSAGNLEPRFGNRGLHRTPKSTHHPHKINDQHRECKTGGGAYFAFFLGSVNPHTTPPKIPPDEEGLLWGWCVAGGPLLQILGFHQYSSRQISRHLRQRKAENIFTMHFCRVVVLTKGARQSKKSGKKKAHKHKSFWLVTPPVTGGSPDWEAMGSKFYVLSSEPKEHKSFCPDTRPGGPVTGATGKSFMCKSFMCLSVAARGAEQEGRTRLRGPEVLGPLRGLGIRPLVSVLQGLGNPFPEAP